MHATLRMILLIAAASLLAAVGCTDERAATCETVTDHVMTLQADEREDKGLEPMGAESAALRRKRAVEQCERRNPSQEELTCLITSTSRKDVQACQGDGKE